MKQIWIKNLFKCYGKNVIINNYSGILTSENIYFLISENGSGKTTFFKCLLNNFLFYTYKALGPFQTATILDP